MHSCVDCRLRHGPNELQTGTQCTCPAIPAESPAPPPESGLRHGVCDAFLCSVTPTMASSTTASVSASSAAGPSTSVETVVSAAEPSAVAAAEQLPSAPGEASVVPAAGAAANKALEKEFQWPAVSFARMRAGLRSALQTDCSGFKFQNGGRSLRWLRAAGRHEAERARLFWHGFVSLFDVFGEIANICKGCAVWNALARLDRVYRDRYAECGASAPGADRSHAKVMLADGNVERAVRWAMGPRSGLDSTWLLSDKGNLHAGVLLALALEGGWTWLLEPWQAAMESSNSTCDWQTMIAAAAIEAQCLPLAKEHWPHLEAREKTGFEVWRAIARSGSTEVFDWLVDNGAADGATEFSGPFVLLQITAEYGHVALMEQAAARVPAVRFELDQYDDSFLQRACWGGHLRTVEWLISRGATLRPSAVESAARFGHHSLVCYLCEMSGMSGAFRLHDTVSTLLCRSTPDCLAVLEYAMRHLHCTPSPSDIVRAATTANVRPDVLHFLSAHSTQEVWEAALADDNVRSDLDVQDLLHAAAATPGNEKG